MQDVHHVNSAKLERYLFLLTVLEENLAEYEDIKTDLNEVRVQTSATYEYRPQRGTSTDLSEVRVLTYHDKLRVLTSTSYEY